MSTFEKILGAIFSILGIVVIIVLICHQGERQTTGEIDAKRRLEKYIHKKEMKEREKKALESLHSILNQPHSVPSYSPSVNSYYYDDEDDDYNSDGGETPDDAFSKGYDDGYEQGLEDGRNGYSHGSNYDDRSSYSGYYERRYQDGYEDGYEDGYYRGMRKYNEEHEDDY